MRPCVSREAQDLCSSTFYVAPKLFSLRPEGPFSGDALACPAECTVAFSTDFNEPTTRPGLKARVRDVKTRAELTAIQEVLATTNWNRKLAARQLNISYKALLYKIKQYGDNLRPTVERASDSTETNGRYKRRTTAG
jgi:DNA-binding NtrC family response regulator